MKLLILGAGGTGGCLGGFLKKQGADVTLIARGEHLNALRSRGLTVHSARAGSFTVFPKVFSTEEYLTAGEGTPEVIFVCVKSYSLPQLLPFLQKITTPETVVIPLLNVFGIGGELQQALPAAVTDGCMYIYSMIERPGVIVQPTAIFRVLFGCRRQQPHRADGLLRRVEALLRDSGIDGCFTDEIEREAMIKFSFVSPLGAAGYVYDAPCGVFRTPGEPQSYFLALVREAAALGRAMGIELPLDLAARNLALLHDMDPDGTTSMLRDIRAGKSSEFDGLVLRVCRLARQYRLPTPAYDRAAQKMKEENAAKPLP